MDWISIGMSVAALIWLALREIAPRTSNKWDDAMLDFANGVAEALGKSPDDLMKRGRKRTNQQRGRR